MTPLIFINLFLPLFLISAGGFAGHLANRDNIALEGIISGGAFCAFMIRESGGSLPLVFVGAAFSGILCGTLLFLISDRIKGDIFLTGLGLNLFLPALASFISKKIYGSAGVLRISREMTDSGFLLPGLLLLLGAACILFIELTPTGLLLKTAGTAPARLQAKRIKPSRISLFALMISGTGAALAGAYLVLRLGAYTPGISAGKGWLALIAIYLAGKRTSRLIPPLLLLAAASAAGLYLQGVLEISQTLITGVPYYISLIAIGLIYPLRKLIKKPFRQKE